MKIKVLISVSDLDDGEAILSSQSQHCDESESEFVVSYMIDNALRSTRFLIPVSCAWLLDISSD
jgi:hypothetical protein